MAVTVAGLSDGLPNVGWVSTFADFAPRIPICGVRGPQVVASQYPGACTACRVTSDPLLEAGVGQLCLGCAGFGHLVFLQSGDPALSRRAKLGSQQSAVVVRVNWMRQRYERRGILVEYSALEPAARECLADPSALAGRSTRDTRRIAKGGTPWEDVAAAISLRFPGCPRAEVIAYHVALRCPEAIELAVAESVRHVDADGDERRVSAILDAWRAGVIPLDE